MDNGLVKTNRLVVIDSLRGFAIAAVFLIHTTNHFLSGIFPAESDLFCADLDVFLKNLMYFCFENKAFCIFALFFGFTFALQKDKFTPKVAKIAAKTVNFKTFMVKRIALLVLFGILNAAFFAGGDPLVFYALCMFIVIPLENLKTKWIAFLTVVLLIQPTDVIHSFVPLWEYTYYDEYGKISEVLMTGDMFDTFWANITYGLKGCLLWALQEGRFVQTLGLFMLGILAYRLGWFRNTEKWSRKYILFILTTILLYIVQKYCIDFFKMYYNLAFTASIIAVYAHLFNKFGNVGIFKHFSVYGKMSLTNFVGQSIFGAILYYPWALNLGVKLGVTVSLLITIVLIVMQIAFSHLWLRKHRRGPLEELWSRLTFNRR
ncbi:MAG: DUF418 domain-containing protein [Rikenellaceae bacterium]